MTRRTSRDLLIAAGGLAGAFGLLTLYVRFSGTIPGDGRALRFARDHGVHRQNVADVYSFIGTLGTPAVGLATTLVAAVLVFTNVGARAAALVLASALIVLAEHPLASAVGTTDAATALGFKSGGFPSGHTLYATAVFGMLAVLGRRHGRPDATFIAVVAIGLTAVQRVVTGAHLLDETVAGMLLGGAWLCLVLAVDARA